MTKVTRNYFYFIHLKRKAHSSGMVSYYLLFYNVYIYMCVCVYMCVYKIYDSVLVKGR